MYIYTREGCGGKDVGHFVWFSKDGRRAEGSRWRERGRELSGAGSVRAGGGDVVNFEGGGGPMRGGVGNFVAEAQ